MHADLEFSEYIFCLTGEYVPQGLVKLLVLLSTQVKIFCMYVDYEYMKYSLLPTVTTLLNIHKWCYCPPGFMGDSLSCIVIDLFLKLLFVVKHV